MQTTRTVDETGLIWQEGPYGEKMVGEVHVTKAGRYFVIIVGRRITDKNLTDWHEAKQLAETWQPTDPEDVDVLNRILDPTWRAA